MEWQLFTMSRLVEFLGRTDGRDKFAKGLQNYCRYRKWSATQAGVNDAQKMFKGTHSPLVGHSSPAARRSPFSPL